LELGAEAGSRAFAGDPPSAIEELLGVDATV
jgi:hypothetical protein